MNPVMHIYKITAAVEAMRKGILGSANLVSGSENTFLRERPLSCNSKEEQELTEIRQEMSGARARNAAVRTMWFIPAAERRPTLLECREPGESPSDGADKGQIRRGPEAGLSI